ncbi:MAG: hypothetical protein QXH95_03415 [Thermoplasmata archaeon]
MFEDYGYSSFQTITYLNGWLYIGGVVEFSDYTYGPIFEKRKADTGEIE